MGSKQKRGICSHESTKMITDTWLTPPSIINSLGKFDLDPCTPIVMPWKTAEHRYTIIENGLLSKWFGRVWLNPPYGSELIKWMAKMANHNNGIALTFARTETKCFQKYVFPFATSMLFIAGRLFFHNENGIVANGSGGAPSVLISYGEENADYISDSGIDGKHVLINSIPVITIEKSPDWKSVVSISLIQLNGKGSLKDIYKMAEIIAPDKTIRNKNYQAKIRQKLQKYFNPVDRGVWSLFDN